MRTFRGGAFRLIRKYKNAFLRFYRIYTEMALPESSASAYSAISANIKFIGQPRPRDYCGYPKFSSAWSADQISTAAPLLCSLFLPQAALTGKLPIPPYPHIKFSSSKFYTARTFRGGAFRLIRIHENFATGFGIFTPIKCL